MRTLRFVHEAGERDSPGTAWGRQDASRCGFGGGGRFDPARRHT